MSSPTITFAGHSAVFIEIGEKKIAIDPWLQGNPRCPQTLMNPSDLDLIVLTHGHADHASDVVRICGLNNAKIAATYELAMIIIGEGVDSSRVIPMNKGGSVTIDSVTITLTQAQHSSSFDSPTRGTLYAGEACGVIVATDEYCIFHAGDTELFSDLALIGELYQPQVALLPIGDRFTMGPSQAAMAAHLLGVAVAIPIHYGTFDLLTGSAHIFRERCAEQEIQAIELAPGTSYSLPTE
jgi:L-ascorbate metabolism protein UlaG (beta-lactamase superfamily)